VYRTSTYSKRIHIFVYLNLYLGTTKFTTPKFTFANMPLNYSIPDALIGVVFGPNNLANLETLSLDVPLFGNSTTWHRRINETIIGLAALYEQANGTINVHEVADYLGCATYKAQKLEDCFGGDQTFMQSVLWGSRFVKEAKNFSVQRNLLALIVVFSFVSYFTTILRLWSRWRLHDNGIRHVDYCLVAALVLTTIISGAFGNSKSHSLQSKHSNHSDVQIIDIIMLGIHPYLFIPLEKVY
jgi:hypothetical protein